MEASVGELRGAVLKRPPKEERIPLQRLDGSRDGHWSRCCSSHGGTFNVILLCMASVTVAITIALVVHIANDPSQLRSFHGLLVTTVDECSEIGLRVLRDGGSAVDASIATLLCLTVTSPHSVSIGSGGFMIVHEKDGEDFVINFREMAPRMISRSSNVGDENVKKIAIPGVLRGLKMAYDKYGTLSWKRLVTPAATLAKEGFTVTTSLAQAIRQSPPKASDLRRILVPNGIPVEAGEKVVWESLGLTLRVIAEDGADAFYSGNLTAAMIEELDRLGSALTTEDFSSYSAVGGPPVVLPVKGRRILLPPLPSSSPALGLILSLSSSFNDSGSNLLTHHHLIEAIKIASAAVITAGSPLNSELAWNTSENILSKESTEELREHIQDNSAITLGNVPNLRSPASAINIAVESDKMLVGLVSTLGSTFGSQVVTSSGIVFNDAMEDFFPSTYPEDYKNNFYVPLRRPLSTMALAVILDDEHLCDKSRTLLSGSDYQIIAQGIIDVERYESLAVGLERPRFKAVLGVTNGDVAVDPHNIGLSARLMDELHQVGHIIFEADKIVTSVSAVRKKGVETETYYKDS